MQGSSPDTEITYLGTEITLSGLEPCTDYEFQLGTVCGSATSDLVDANFSTACVNAADERPLRILAFQVYPNPSPGVINLEFDLQEGGPVVITVHAATGAQVWGQHSAELQPGRHHLAIEDSVQWPAGMYFVRLQMGNEVAVRTAVRE